MNKEPFDENASMLPPTTKNGWMIIYGVVAVLAITGVILGALYRDTTKPGEVISRDRQKHAKRVVYTVVFSSVAPQKADSIIDRITQDIGADTAKTDMIIGSPTTDPWCASIGEYRRNLKKAMLTSKVIPIGKQSVIVSMIGGLLIKNGLPATLYFVGNMTDDDISTIIPRSSRTAASLELRSRIMGPVNIVNFMDTTHPGNAAYVRLYKGKVPVASY
ncbi:MAG: hypothetical protein FGM33_07565 [Candidatus Kapabacteria bacterium]|nr:hypothetical protein [Candidatus Kapabacteria bacterium]